MSKINKINENLYKCQCEYECSKTVYYEHKKRDKALKELYMIGEPMDVDTEDVTNADASSENHQQGNENTESGERASSGEHYDNASPLPTEPLAMVLFLTITIFQNGYLTDAGVELLMQCFNRALQVSKCTYRFPARATTFRDWCRLSTFVFSGMLYFANCITCHAIYPFTTLQDKAKVVQHSLCSAKDYIPGSKRCGAPLLTTGLKPLRTFVYNSVVQTLQKFFLRENFESKINQWRSRVVPENYFFDIWDGSVWNQFKMNGDEEPFVFASEYNLMLTLNVDWFQLYANSQYSCGAVYLTIQNLPREERNLKKNVILVCLLPGPSEPSTFEMNKYLDPLVDELLLLEEGVFMKTMQNGMQKVRAALTLVTMDLPAQRKCLGFTSHSSAYACHKCDKKFDHLSDNCYRLDFSDLDSGLWVPRTNASHRTNAEAWLSASTHGQRTSMEQSNGTRWSSLLRLSYFDPVRFATIDVMHNCYLGTAKRLMCQVWRNPDCPVPGETECILTKRSLVEMSQLMTDLVLPLGYDGSSIARKILIGDGFSYMKADEWKVWITVLSPLLLAMRMKPAYLDHWMLFVEANRYLANTCISRDEVEAAHAKLQLFLEQSVQIYGNSGLLTINSHNHLHIKEGILDYGPAMSHWLFNFERYNSQLKGIETNRKGCVEETLMKRFLNSVHEEDFFDSLPLSIDDKKIWRSVFRGEKKLGSVVEAEVEADYDEEDDDDEDALAGGEEDDSVFDIGSFLEDEKNGEERFYGYEHIPPSVVNSVKMKVRETLMDNDSFKCLVDYYHSVYPGAVMPGESALAALGTSNIADDNKISRKISKFPSLSIFANHYRSVEGGSSRNNHRGSYASIYWDDHSDRDVHSSAILRPAQIQYFFVHTVQVKGMDDCWHPITHLFAMVRWFCRVEQTLETFAQYGIETWSSKFEEASKLSVVPVMRIHSPIAVKLNYIDGNHPIIKLPRKLLTN